MTFEEIFNQNGYYVADGFAEGYCVKVENSCLYGVQYNHKDDINPDVRIQLMHKSLLTKDYRMVFTRESLFK